MRPAGPAGAPARPGAARAPRFVQGRRPSGDRGSGTVLALAVAAVTLLVTALLGLLATSTLAHARAQGAADLAALAAASRLQRTALFGADAGELVAVASPGSPCDLAAAVADRNGSHLDTCEVGQGGVVTVAVAVGTPAGVVATAKSRAGPRTGPGGASLGAPSDGPTTPGR